MSQSGSVSAQREDTEAEQLKYLKLLFLLCSSKKSESPRYSLFMFVLCCRGFVGSTGVDFSRTHCQIKHFSLAMQKYLHAPQDHFEVNTTRSIKSKINCCRANE